MALGVRMRVGIARGGVGRMMGIIVLLIFLVKGGLRCGLWDVVDLGQWVIGLLFGLRSVFVAISD
jgi:hypothetical protein